MTTTTKPYIIGIGGLKRHGKNSVAKCISAYYNKLSIQTGHYAFADKLKQEVAEGFNVRLGELEIHKEFWRPILQFWGTEFRRQYQKNDNYWISRLDEEIKMAIFDYHSSYKFIPLITDVRFPNELKYIKENYNGLTIWVNRNAGFDNTDKHASENSLTHADFDLIVDNNGTLEDLQGNINAALEHLKFGI